MKNDSKATPEGATIPPVSGPISELPTVRFNLTDDQRQRLEQRLKDQKEGRVPQHALEEFRRKIAVEPKPRSPIERIADALEKTNELLTQLIDQRKEN